MKSTNAHLFYELWGLNGVRKTKRIKINIYLTYLDAEKAWDIPCLSLKGLRRQRKQISSSNGDPVPSFLFRCKLWHWSQPLFLK